MMMTIMTLVNMRIMKTIPRCRFSCQQLERDGANMIRKAETAMRTNWSNTNNAFK